MQNSSVIWSRLCSYCVVEFLPSVVEETEAEGIVVQIQALSGTKAAYCLRRQNIMKVS